MPYSSDQDSSHQVNKTWVYLGGTALSATAGYINVVMLEFFYVPVSHMTGAISRLSIDLGKSQLVDFKIIFGIFIGFLLGAVLSGLVIGHTKLKPGRRYGFILIFEALLLALVSYWSNRGIKMAVPLAAMACGLQNAMASSYYSLVVRTTHVTGLITDIGVLLGQGLRYRRLKLWKLALLSSLLLGFFFGGVCAAWAYSIWHTSSLYLASLSCLLIGLIYLSYLYIFRKLALT